MAVQGGLIQLTGYAPGVYLVGPDGRPQRVHAYDGGDFHLADIVEFFELGELLEEDGAPGIELDDKEIRQLVQAVREFGSDHPEEFIACCMAIVQAAGASGDAPYCFYENF